MFDLQKKKEFNNEDKEKTLFAVRNSFKDLFSANVQSNIPLDNIMNSTLTNIPPEENYTKPIETIKDEDIIEPEIIQSEIKESSSSKNITENHETASIENTEEIESISSEVQNYIEEIESTSVEETNTDVQDIPEKPETVGVENATTGVQDVPEKVETVNAENTTTDTQSVTEETNLDSVEINTDIKVQESVLKAEKKPYLNDDLLEKNIELTQAISNSMNSLSKKETDDIVPEKTAEYFKKSATKPINNINNDTLLISEKDNKVFLPYTMDDINDYLNNFSYKYSTAQNVIENEFVLPLNYFDNFRFAARFREAYALYKDREGKTTLQSISFALRIMKIGNLNPAVIAACKNEKILNDYIEHLENNDLQNFTYFKVSFRINPSTK